MRLNGFLVIIPQGTETDSGYVNMKHNTKYTINLYNNKDVDCDAEVVVDGKSQGGFRVPKHGKIVLERPSHDTGHFTCYKLGTPEGESAQLVAGDNLGLISVTFKPERVRVVNRVYAGASSQKFGSIAALDYDESQITTINLRLVVADDEPRPLTSAPHKPVIPAPV